MTDLVGLGLALVGFVLVAVLVGVLLRLWIKRGEALAKVEETV